jgi:hypothetical protein
VMKQREGRASGTAQHFGGLNVGERMAGLNALKLLSERGIGNLPPELQSMAAQIAPEYVATQREKFGESALKNEAMGLLGSDRFREIFGNDFDNSLSQQRADIDKIQADVRVNIQLDEEALAKNIAEALGPVLSQLVKQTQAAVEQQGRDIRTGAAIGSNMRN